MSLKCLDAAENEFLAEDTLVTVVSNMDHPRFVFISGYFGPMESGMPCVLPLWLAITLRKRGKCTIQPPGWMAVDALEQSIEYERTAQVLGEIPFHYMEIAQLILQHARADVKSADQVAVLLQDLENIRLDRIKMVRSLYSISYILFVIPFS